MIFHRAAQREFLNTAATVFVALFAILMTTQLIRLLGQAAGGQITPRSVVALLGFGALNYLSMVLTLTLFIAVLLTLSRAYRDSEMVIWFSAGISLGAWVRPVMRFALPVIATVAALSLFLSPWALMKSTEYRQQIEQRSDVSKVSPGAFNESSQADRVFFVEATAGDQEHVRNVFISSVQQGRLGVVAAAQGHAETSPNGDRFMVLEKGRRYEGTPGTAAYRVMDFQRYAVRIEAAETRQVEQTQKQLPLWELVRNPTPLNLSELLWRIGIPVSAFILALLAIPLSFVNPRAGRTNNLIFALLTFVLYSNLISLSQAWVLQGRLSFAIGVWLVHVVMFVALILLFYRRISVFFWGRLWR